MTQRSAFVLRVRPEKIDEYVAVGVDGTVARHGVATALGGRRVSSYAGSGSAWR